MLLHNILVAFVAEDVDIVNVEPSQIASSSPALEVGATLMRIFILSIATGQELPCGVAVKVSVTIPVSPKPGVYTGVRVVEFTSVPVPFSVH